MNNDDDEEFEYYTRDEVLAIATAEARRELTVDASAIRYVAFIPDFNDYAFCEFVLEDEGWVKTCRLLANHERLPEEEIQDCQILKLAREGNLLSALRLYRAKYEVGLLEGKAGLEALMREA